MQIQLNGSPKTIPEAMTITGLLQELEVPPKSVVVELNRSILQSERHAEIVLQDNDQVEIIRFVGGG